MIELIFVLARRLVDWLASRPHSWSNADRPASWLILSVALILWGLRALYGPRQWWSRWENWTRGLSLMLLGVVMLVISRVPFEWVGPLLATAGVLLVLTRNHRLRSCLPAALHFADRVHFPILISSAH